MLGLSGAVVIVGSSVYLGYTYVKYQETRLNRLVEFRNVLKALQSDIEYSSRPLSDACIMAGQRAGGYFGQLFEEYGRQIEEDKELDDPKALWKSKIAIASKELNYDETLKSIYESFVICLGILDRGSQLSNLNVTILDVETKMNTLREMNEKRLPVAMKLSVTGGLVLAMILF